MKNLFILIVILFGCSDSQQNSEKVTNDTGGNSNNGPVIIANPDPDQPFRFPLLTYGILQPFGNFNSRFNKYHSADDLQASSGTAVYAAGDGVIVFSGPLAGYGWLIAIDHSDYGVYSLYGHLSSSREHHAVGNVSKGDIIAYIADDDEDGSGPQDGSGTYPYWAPHLHFGIRSGSQADYPSIGDDRWMAGYTDSSPKSIGWLSPNEYILDTH